MGDGVLVCEYIVNYIVSDYIVSGHLSADYGTLPAQRLSPLYVTQ
jgi:hypothetical protein